MIKPILISNFNSFSGTSFKGKREKSLSDYNNSTPHSGIIKKIPVITMIALSPIVSPLKANAQIETEVDSAKIELVSTGKDVVYSNGEACQFLKYSYDNDDKNSEILSFRYVNENKNKKGFLTGVFQAICPQKTRRGKYIVTYVDLIDGKFSKDVKFCLVPEKFGKYILEYEWSNENNKAVRLAPRQLFEKAFGLSSIADAPDIKDVVTEIRVKK